MERNLFEIATRKKFRYPYNGMISTEDLWDLPVEKLDTIYKKLTKEKKNDEEDSLLTLKTKNNDLEDCIEIVKFVVAYKLNAAEEAKKKAEARRKNQRIMELIAKKQDEKLESLPIEELEKLLDGDVR